MNTIAKLKVEDRKFVFLKEKIVLKLLMLIMMMRIIVLIHPLDKAMFVIKRIHIVGCAVGVRIMNMLMVVKGWSFKM